MNCPNECDNMEEVILIDIQPNTYAKILAENIRSRKGITGVTITEVTPEITIQIKIDQHEYESHNHFYYRNEYEQNAAFKLNDQESGTVLLKYTGRPITRANKCVNCGMIYHQNENINPSLGDEFDPSTHMDDWSFPI